ncbi:MAG TPA: ATP-binding cassette domain-containing protein [Chitinophagaceae bacterium]|jgi:phospholipid/cholesterol/gamma-HCH transport system ATP-binding protein|nr:ATP-binding cassette domain-containing protein [Chitinophagaceae bacterium]
MFVEEEIIENAKSDLYEKNVLVIEHLHKAFGNNHVLVDFNMVLGKGENLVVLGKSGCGKSVLIKCIIGLLKPDRGKIEMFGRDVPELGQEELDKLRVKVGFLFQSNALYDSMTVRENLEFPLRRLWIKYSRKLVNDLVMETLGDVGLTHTVDMMPAELSGGMRKRIALARTLILKPEIILYDEPTTGLDPITGKEIIELMLTVQKKYNAASVIISHDMNCVKMASDRVIILLDGKCYANGTIDELRKVMDPKVKQFFE